ncbi:MAG: serine hydrolase domain-containing protein [Gemmatimonadaceae bacterium]
MNTPTRFRCADLASVSVLLVVTVSTAAAQSSDSRSGARLDGLRMDSTRIDSVFARFDSSHSPGCALGIIRAGRTVYARGYGMADLENATPITPRTVFDIGSTSKQFTAASIALLAADGRLSLDDDVRKYIPELPKYGKPITLRHLLQHTSGLRDYIGIMSLAGFRLADMTTDAEALDAITRQKALNFPPGSEHYYSNSGYLLASIVIERASGMSLAAFARKRIFEPLRMTSTLVRSRHALLIPRRATGYSPGDSSGFVIDMSDWEQTGDGAVHTTVEDLAIWDQNYYTPTVGGQQLLERLLAPGHLDNGKALTYALGLFVDEYRGLRRVHHGGSWAGYRAELLRFPDQHVSVAVLCNLATASASGLAGQVATILLAEHLKPESKAEQRAQAAETGAPPPATREAAAAGAELARYTGLYFHQATSAFRRVAIDSGRLVLNISGTVLPLHALGGDRFQSTEHPVTIAFQTAKPGAPLRLIETIAEDSAVTYEPMPPAAINARGLAAYTGTYDSRELATAWTLTIRDSVLILQHRSQGDTRLEPAFADAFTAGPSLVRFTRGEGGRITGFSVSIGRARNIGFVRRRV